MGQKVNPIGYRLGIYRNWDARWFSDHEYTKLLHEDIAMRKLINSRLRNAAVARIETERSANQLTVVIQTAKPGIVIGKQGTSVDSLRDELEKISGKRVRVTIHEIKQPELDAKLVSENVAAQLEKRIAFRRAIKQAVMRTMRAGAKGVRVEIKGRLGGAEMRRREWERDGRVPLHTLRANIDFGITEAKTTFGRIGVKVWIYKGDFVTATGDPIQQEMRLHSDDYDNEGGNAPGIELVTGDKVMPVEAVVDTIVTEPVEEVVEDVPLPDEILTAKLGVDVPTDEVKAVTESTAKRPATRKKAATTKPKAPVKRTTAKAKAKPAADKEAPAEEESE